MSRDTLRTYVALMRMAGTGQETQNWPLTRQKVNAWLVAQGHNRISLEEEVGFLRLAVDGLCVGDRYTCIGRALSTKIVTQYITTNRVQGAYRARRKWPWNTVPEEARGRGRPRKAA